MKKIKAQLKKAPLKSTPRVALLILAEQRHKMLRLMLDWYQELSASLEGEVMVRVYVASRLDVELAELVGAYPEVELLSLTAGAPHGERNNEALMSLKAHDIDAVLPVLPGDLLTAGMIKSYGAHLKEGGLFAGLLDTYIYDPTEFKFMYWAQHRYESHSSRVAPIGYMLSRPLLDALKWRLWPNQVKPADGFHKSVLDRLVVAFQQAPQGSCISQTMEKYGGAAMSLKSELARALYEEGNWQKLQGLSYRSFEAELEGQLSEEWVSRLNMFDERIKLEILLEEPPEGAPRLWQTHYNFCVYKFLPYADVRLRLLSSSDTSEVPSGWSRLLCEGDSAHERYQSALSQLREQNGDLYLFAGQGGLVDLKTLEHYLIHTTREGARLLVSQNFFISDLETRKLYFWPGSTQGHFTKLFGFGACLHRAYLERCDWELFSDTGLTERASEALTSLAQADQTRSQTVFFKCATHKLGLISMGFEGLLGFQDQVRLSDLRPVSLSQLPPESYHGDSMVELKMWLSGVDHHIHKVGPNVRPAASSTTESNMSTMNPLEKAKSLLSQATSGSAPAPGGVSALERAKALLAKSQGTQAPATELGSAERQRTSEEMSPLDKAKALLAKHREESAQAAAPVAQAAPAPAPAKMEGLSPLERAKALLARAEQSTVPEPAQAQEEGDDAKSVIDSAIENAEHIVAQLTAQRDAALKAVQEATARQGREENPASALLCEQGEVAFGEGALEKAAQLFESALLVDVNSTRALSNLGVVAMQLDQPWQALSYLLVALIKDHEDENVVANLQGLLSTYPELKVAQSLFA